MASSTAFFAALFLARRKIGAWFLFIPTGIAAARVIAGAHYLSDVTFAAALGIASALIVVTPAVVSRASPARLAR